MIPMHIFSTVQSLKQRKLIFIFLHQIWNFFLINVWMLHFLAGNTLNVEKLFDMFCSTLITLPKGGYKKVAS